MVVKTLKIRSQTLSWRKSSRSTQDHACVEAAADAAAAFARDSKLAESPELAFEHSSWEFFLSAMK
ncbi:DUF397 domain-containing protein [Embleya sp. NPDC005971]|uniref:DUF397 domain-containing protein n=1 Tax=unclassified Embleya TaxID=2699296 RepID=UPI0033C5C8D1